MKNREPAEAFARAIDQLHRTGRIERDGPSPEATALIEAVRAKTVPAPPTPEEDPLEPARREDFSMGKVGGATTTEQRGVEFADALRSARVGRRL